MTLRLQVNGRAVEIDADADAPLLELLRNGLGLRGSRFGCGLEQCGACMVLLDGEPVYACTLAAGAAAGRNVVTVEGLGTPATPHPLQAAFLEEQAGQCGYCLSGILIAAKELDVEPERLRLVSGDTDATPNEGYTAGSRSIEISGGALRLVCAEIRALFLDAAARRIGCAVTELSIENGRFMRAGRDTGLDYRALANAVDLGRDANGSAPTKRPADYRVVGRSLPRLDLPAKVFGAAFVHDIAPEDVIHARVLHRPW